MKIEKARYSKDTFGNKRVDGFAVSDIKNYYKTIVIKMRY